MDFQALAEQAHPSAPESRGSDGSQASSPEARTDNTQVESRQANQDTKDAVQAILDLEKVAKFKFGGQEFTPKDLQNAILRQKDYTHKTQSLSKDREAFESEKNFYRHLSWDLQKVLQNPQLSGEFLKTYPEQFHHYLKAAFDNEAKKQNQTQPQSTQPQTHSRTQPDIELLTRLQKIESTQQAQEQVKNEMFVDKTVDDLSKKYPGKLVSELAIARVHDAAVRKVIDPGDIKVWEQAFKESAEHVKNLLKEEYGQMVKKQTEANTKGKDVPPGGGIVGRAPPKFKSIQELTKFANSDESGLRRRG